MENLTIYAISGLGADERAFQYLQLDFHIRVLPWICPQKNESFQAYASRFSEQINESKPFALLGVSFGGMLAVELNTILKPAFTIIISSAAVKTELPLITDVAGICKLIKIIPATFLKLPGFMAYWLFGAREFSHRRLLNEILKDTDPYFLKWAILKIVKWNSSKAPANLFRIHGKKDRLIRFQEHKDQIAIA